MRWYFLLPELILCAMFSQEFSLLLFFHIVAYAVFMYVVHIYIFLSLPYDEQSWLMYFWATVCKTVRPVLSDLCLSLMSVCDVGVLWPNGWMDQDETWRAETWPWTHSVRWGTSSPSPKGAQPPPQFLVCVHCGQTAGWIKMALGMELGFSPSYVVLDGDPAPLPKKGPEAHNFRPMSVAAKQLDTSRYHLV